MEGVRSVNNLYRGVNAHLHSWLQREGGWNGFHARHIVHIADALALRLRPMGYQVTIEESLQIRRLYDVQDYRSELLISSGGDTLYRSAASATARAEGALTIGALMGEALSDKPYPAIALRRRATSSDEQPIAWMELLSPTNKGASSDADAYRSKRMNLLSAGPVVVEIDYLHETPPTFETIPRYAPSVSGEWNPNARPYRILVLDPRPTLEVGPAWVNEFGVDEPIPRIRIPLVASDQVEVDFNASYRQTFSAGFYGDFVDYSKEPPGFDHYAPWDQVKILGRMLAVLEEYSQQSPGELSGGIEPYSGTLESLLERLAAWES